MAKSKSTSGSSQKKKVVRKTTTQKPNLKKTPLLEKKIIADKIEKTNQTKTVKKIIQTKEPVLKTASVGQKKVSKKTAPKPKVSSAIKMPVKTETQPKEDTSQVSILKTETINKIKTSEKNVLKQEQIGAEKENKISMSLETKPETDLKVIQEKPKKEDIVMEKPEPKQNQPELQPLKELSQEELNNTLLMECAWEVCNQVGGIYTVIQSKVPATKIKWGENYLLMGPYFEDQAAVIFEHDKDLYNNDAHEQDNPDPIREVVKEMHRMGYDVHYGTWLIDGRPKAVLFNPESLLSKIHEHKYIFWEHHNISLPGNEKLVDNVVSFGFQVFEFIRLLSKNEHNTKRLLAHFHEWMSGIPVPELRRHKIDVKIVFTTHATMLGRYLAMNDPKFYDHLPFYDWLKEAKHFNISHIVEIERAASHGAHIFSTVSDITANECKYLIGRQPEAILPNGLNIKRFEVMHEFQQIHKQNKGKINEFVMGHFFHNYTFDLDKTLYFFTSGRFEHYNKGFDLTLEALARLNWMMKNENIDKTVVMFFITKNPYRSINSSVLESRANLEEIRRNCDDIQKMLADKLFNVMLSRDDINVMPNLNALVDDYLALRLRRNIGSWRNKQMPLIVTHDLVDEQKDPIMNFLKTANLLNYREDKVKMVYHPDFISTANSLFRMDYLQFVRGCHLGIFPSYYEPWGYTPLECCASGLPSITTDLAGFGSYVKNHVEDNEDKGLWIVNRRNRPSEEVAEKMAKKMFEFVKLDRRERIAQRNRIEESSAMFGWRQLRKYYDNAYAMAFEM